MKYFYNGPEIYLKKRFKRIYRIFNIYFYTRNKKLNVSNIDITNILILYEEQKKRYSSLPRLLDTRPSAT